MFDVNHGSRPRAVAFAIALALGLSGCGGGGGGSAQSSPTPPPATGSGAFAGGHINVNAGDTLVWSDNISGSIDLIKDGGGILVLTGSDSYTGGTTIDQGTLQLGNGGTTGSITGNVLDNAFLVFNRSNDVTFSGVVSGSGSLTQAGMGTLILTGNNTYTGGTTISHGILQLGAGGTTGSIAGDVADNGSLVFDRSDVLTFDGTVSGTGSLEQAGTGTLILTGNNSYTGGTKISHGILQLGAGGTTGSIFGNVKDNGSLVFDRSDDVTFGGVVSGSGTLVKTGDGSLVLTGANTYGGGTTVQGGTLEVASGAALGTGSVAVGNSGIYYYAEHILKVDSGVSLSNQIVMDGYGTLDNAGALGGNLAAAVMGSGALATVLNHDGGSIIGKDSGVVIDDVSTVKNSSGALIEGGHLGVGLGGGGTVTNDGAGSIIRSLDGTAVRISGETGTVENTGGATITSSSTAIYLQHGGTVTNGAGSTIEATGAAAGDCGGAGVCGIYVASGDSTDSTDDGGLALNNGGKIVGNVQMIATARNGATLSAGGSIQGDLNMGSNTGSFLTFDGGAGTTQLLSHAVTGSTTFAGRFFKKGDGTWIIDTDDLGAMANAEISGGVLQVGNGGVEGSLGAPLVQLYAGTALVFDRSDDVLFTGLIEAPGLTERASLVQAGAGELTLADVRGLDGLDLTIQRGTVQLGVGELGPDFYRLNVTNNGSLVFDLDGQSFFGGAIAGTGSLTKEGPGLLILGLGSNDYTGGTTVASGILAVTDFLRGNAVVNAGAVLEGALTDRTLVGLRNTLGNLTSAGKVVVGGGDAVIEGNYSQASTGTLAVSLGSKLSVNGTATLNGGTLEVTGADSGYVSNTHTNVVTASNGVVGTFTQLVKDTGVVFTATTINYDANSVWLDTTGLDVTTAAAGTGVHYTAASMGSAQRVQGAFEQLDDKLATGNLSGVSSDFVRAAGQFQQAPTLQAAQASLQSLSGQLHAASAAMTFESIDASSRALSDHFDQLLDKGAANGMWTHDLNVGGDMSRSGFNSVGFQLNGWLVGNDRQIGRNGVAGYAFGQSRNQQRLNQGYDHDNGRSTEGMFYAGWLNGNWYTQGRVGFGSIRQDVSRRILLGESAQGVGTQYNGNYSVAYEESGLHFGVGSSYITPYVNVQYARISRDGFNEQGAGGFGLRSDAQTLDRWQAGVGLRAAHRWSLGGDRAVDFNVRAQWQQTMASHGDVFDASFVGMQEWQPLLGVGLSRYSGLFGVGMDATLSKRTTLKFSYDYEMGQRDRSQMLSTHLNVAF